MNVNGGTKGVIDDDHYLLFRPLPDSGTDQNAEAIRKKGRLREIV